MSKHSTKPPSLPVSNNHRARNPGRRLFNNQLLALFALSSLPVSMAGAKTYLTVDQARQLLWGDTSMQPVAVTLSEQQMQAIRQASGIRVRNPQPQVWRTDSGGWFIVDQVIGKHENIDMAFALNGDGTVKGLEILTYRETYGYEVANPKWRAQFHGADHQQRLQLDRQIKNISGATLSCRHITEGINRLTQTWHLVLRNL